MPLEVWTYILKFLNAKDIYLLKFICKMFKRIVFLNKDIKYYTEISHEIFDIESYYGNFNMQLQIFFDKIKKNLY